jgi:cell division protein FtsL
MTEDKDQLHTFTLLEKAQMTVCVIAAIVFVATLISAAL